jgi:dihydroflavonol-4-reductase
LLTFYYHSGTRFVLEACLKSDTLKRVVVTSSTAAIAPEGVKSSSSPLEYTAKGWSEGAWNHTADVKETPYPRSKVEAEQFAWQFVGMHSKSITWDLVTVNPSAIFGPVLFPPKNRDEINTSNQLIEKILNKA